MRAPSDARGFTLIEVLVAFVITALLLVAVLRSLTLSLDGADRSDGYTKATIMAESALDALGLVTPLADGQAGEAVEGPFRLQTTVERYRDDAGVTDDGRYLVLYRLSAVVSWRDRGRDRAVSLSTLRLGLQR